jgi:hypothetical protein
VIDSKLCSPISSMKASCNNFRVVRTRSAVCVPLIIGIVLMAAYVVYALNAKRELPLNVRLFESVNFSASNILLILSGIITGMPLTRS